MRRALGMLALLVAIAATGCLGQGGDDDYQPAPLASPKGVRLAVYERSYSECASYPIERLAAKYGVDPERDQVVEAVGRAWAKTFNGRADAVRSGREGCAAGMNSK